MCRESTDLGVTKVWCGMGWTGQPTIVERDDRTWAIFGGYDGHIHFMDVDTGERILPDVETGDIIKGTPTIDPEGYPLVYSGSRDNLLRVVALDRPGVAEVLWTLDSESVQPVKWNDDWDSSPIIIGDYMIVGSESSRFWVVKLNRSYDAAGLVQVAPEVVFTDEAWDEEVIADNSGDQHASVESSVTVVERRRLLRHVGRARSSATTSAGIDDGGEPRAGVPLLHRRRQRRRRSSPTTRGCSTSPAQNDRPRARGPSEVGQLTKLDPSKPDNPIVWKFNETERRRARASTARPACYGDTIVHHQRRRPPDRRSTAPPARCSGSGGCAGPAWGSPVIVDDVLLIGDCLEGNFHAFDVSDPDVAPPELWSVAPRRLHRGHPRRVEGPHLHRLPQRATSTPSGELASPRPVRRYPRSWWAVVVVVGWR